MKSFGVTIKMILINGLVFCSLLVFLEGVSWVVLQRSQLQQPFLVLQKDELNKTYGSESDLRFTSFDSASVWAHNQKKIKLPDLWTLNEGYVENQPLDPKNVEKTILIFGGSTTDLAFQDNNWPLYLDEEFKSKGASVKIFLGAVAGMSSPQELRRLLRDIRALRPDLVISYSGVNELDTYTKEHPMVTRFEASLYRSLFESDATRFLPNTYLLLKMTLHKHPRIDGVVLGKTHSSSLAQTWFDHMLWMKLISESMNSKFVGFLQPAISVGSKRLTSEEKVYLDEGLGPEYSDFYEAAIPKTDSVDYLVNFVEVFAPLTEAIFYDSCHVNETGNRIVAREILKHLERTSLL